MIRPKHVFRAVCLCCGVALTVLALVDGYNDFLKHLDSQWILGAGVILIGVAARKAAVTLPK
ncbi:hypothetical protein [Vibrio gallicus]|uniref:hypothetical protein n=1 Tax=Vibrio gallicus TaxID=190897 RepID=UPI0021C3D1B8|nr:hypothetical protein [Vibrio gallicus]